MDHNCHIVPIIKYSHTFSGIEFRCFFFLSVTVNGIVIIGFSESSICPERVFCFSCNN